MKNLNGIFWFLPPSIAILTVVCLSLLCSGCYTLKQGAIMLGYLGSAVPLSSVENRKNADADDIRFVEQVNDIRRFAIEELGLKETKNYTKYVTLDRDYLAAIVSASEKDSFTRHEWRFPVVGAVPYKGFFLAGDARKEAKKLQKKDLDVWIRPVDAFSTLGWFRDPLYSFMKEYSASRLADLLIHELVHATVFLKNNVQFNEELAEFIGSKGALLYIERKYGADSPEMKSIHETEKDNKTYIAFIQKLIAQLDEIYSGSLGREEKLLQKETVIHAAQERFSQEYDTLFISDRYRGFSEMNINNAYLELYRLYYAGGSALEEIYQQSGGKLHSFVAAAKTLTNKGPPLDQLRAALSVE
jgi:predicted aminopeptidase